MKIFFVTHNAGKVREFKQILSGVAEVEQLNDDYPELRSDDPEEIVREAVKKLAEKYKKPVVAEDSGIFIKALNGFPGTCSAYTHKRIGLKGLLKLMEGIKDRNCEYRSAVGYCEPGKEAVSFLGTEKGTLAEKERGTNGFGHDPIFIPEGSSKTYGELDDVEEVKKFRRRAVLKLVEYLKK
ncbi:RdgB/HAM1 family non-canonical purine NTP pyrophosphatase [Candidatus Woesearchaeota archaeon]|nr:RdgB/HAM1 family non-canonical purine NTP pyrophosphatase [Candidatus Woesearchaeota archaeon]